MFYFRERRGSEQRAAVGAGLLERFAVFAGAARQLLGSILKWREIQMGRKVLRGRSNERPPRIVRGLEDAFLDFAIALVNVIPRFFREALKLLYVSLQVVRECAHFKRT